MRYYKAVSKRAGSGTRADIVVTGCGGRTYGYERGFTLTELIVVVAIMGVTTVAATPSLLRWLASIRLGSVTQEIASTLQLARVKAITQNANIRINFDTTTNTYQIQQRDPVNLTTWNNVEKVKELPSGVKLVSITGNPITFQSGRGNTPAGNNGTITLQNTQGKTTDVVVARTGRVTVRKH